ncbi:hypothetical protein BDN72DRAFT_901836 [Pluteus cervinus]|uniref:Uncharacterized protein n=1 Tax=Pluteus cervinus TaxID=181527 RepID=A0ACD3AFE2_9AGAR|nr:hypothetical protein BDN72DRAFT_901836 [Pluteus cervinus]
MSPSPPPPSNTTPSNTSSTTVSSTVESKQQPKPQLTQQPNHHGGDGATAMTSTSTRRTSTGVSPVVDLTATDNPTSNPWRDETSSNASAASGAGGPDAAYNNKSKAPETAVLDSSIVSPFNSLTLSGPGFTGPTHVKRDSIIGSGVGLGPGSTPSSPTPGFSFGIGGVDLNQRPPTPPLKPPPPSKEVLTAFDPLQDDQEQAARNAWEMTKGHPPPAVPPKDSIEDGEELEVSITVEPSGSQTPPPPRTSTGPPPSTSFSSPSFPSFAALARTFALPLGGGRHTRPHSMDVARPVPSPASLSSFVAQQQLHLQTRQGQQSPPGQSPLSEDSQLPNQQQPPQEEGSSGGGGFGFGLGFIGIGGSSSRPASRMDGKIRTPTASPGSTSASLPGAGAGSSSNSSPNARANGVSASGGARTTTSPKPTSPTPSSPGRSTQAKPSSDQFDFQIFLDQLKSKSAEPVGKYLRSFLSNFAKRTFTMSDQVKIIGDFLNFISSQMRNCEVWKNATEAEFDNAMEGIEKLVMNRLYEFTFTPEVARAEPRRPITSDDLEKDRVLAQRIALFGWLEEKHLDIPEGEGSKGFMMFAQQELIKINHYKAPRDKLICILNSCKVIFGLIRHLKKEEGADSFVPILIFVVLKANPDHLLSNVDRFRNPAKLQSEAGYYLSSLMGAVSFIENMDHTSLSNITQEEFEKNVESAIQSLPDASPVISSAIPTSYLPYKTLPRAGTPLSLTSSSAFLLSTPPKSTSESLSSTSISTPQPTQLTRPHAGDESATPLSLATPNPAHTLSEDAKRLLQKTGDTISKPLSAIGRIFTEALDGAENKLISSFERSQLGSDTFTSPSNGSSSSSGQQQGGPPPHWLQQEQIRNYPTYQGSGSIRGGVPPQTPGDGRYTPPPIQTPYKPRVRRVPSPSYSQSQGGGGGGYPSSYPGGSPGYVYSHEEYSPTRPGGGGPFTHQSLAMGPSQPYYIGGGGGNGGNPAIPPPQFASPAPTRDTDGGGFASGIFGSGGSFLSPLPARVHSLINSEAPSTYGPGSDISRTPTPNLDIAAIQAQIDSAHEQEQAETESKRETLRQIFPGVDVEIVELVLEGNGGDLGRSIEALLEMSSGE